MYKEFSSLQVYILTFTGLQCITIINLRNGFCNKLFSKLVWAARDADINIRARWGWKNYYFIQVYIYK